MLRRLSHVFTLAACAAGLATLAPAAAFAAPAKTDLSRFATGDLQRLDFSQAGTPAPETTFEAKGGKTASLADFKGKVVVLNLWATWCAPCITEMPSLDKLQAMFPKKDVAVVTVSMDMAGWRVVEPFWQKRGLKNIAPYLDKKNQLALGFKARGLPLTVIYDRKGKEVARIAAPAEWDAKPAIDLIAVVVAQGKK
ncbi:TlpA family protein disulfide reductase [Pedomonas mirosovicensis]|uniref:TlpA family protein disulfide reductase n=1 Tax=Pedomonas mirosovicensis TaxID=2908641 RepID=UPI002167288D|nr:TlpA disulfide reductase family protein [Pedomonas mirosovicensis]MCH8683823.1 TlpA family protein disulfide reductase [Pedomonas mirosovicensis]